VVFERADADLGGGDLGDPLQQVDPTLAQRLDRVVQRRIPAGTARSWRGPRLAISNGWLRVKV
jgi:hypothetical protein